jgi:hypothetical protein
VLNCFPLEAVHLAQRRSDERTERFAHAERLRQERIDTYCADAGALLTYRRLLVLRWFVVHEDRPEQNTPALIAPTDSPCGVSPPVSAEYTTLSPEHEDYRRAQIAHR